MTFDDETRTAVRARRCLDHEGRGHVLLSVTAARRKARNLARDPRNSLTVFDTANPYRYMD
jgi:putative heme iron utilization protein